MKIYLFYQDRIHTFMLPKEISGSYSFDANKNETSKLVNIEARDGKWVIYSVDGVNLIYDRRYVKYLPLQNGTFYVVHRDNKNYLIYVCSVESSKFFPYTFGKGFSMTISNGGGANIIYPCPFLNSNIIKLYLHEKTIYLEQVQTNMVYVNKKLITENQCKIKNGDIINIFGLEIIYLNHLIFINNPNNSLKIPNFDFGLQPYKNNDEEIDKSIIVQDKDLYDKKDYFSKSPRIRRIIETKNIKFSSPPSSGEEQELPFILTVGPMLTMGIMSFVMVVNVIVKIRSGETTLDRSWPQLVTSGAMLMSMLLWPMVIRWYNKKTMTERRQEMIRKYDIYLAEKEKEISAEAHLQRDILIENLISLDDCLNILNQKTIGFWDKRVDQNDFLVVRLGMGSQPLDVNIDFSNQEFTIDEDVLRKRAEALVERYKYIPNVPVSYSFFENRITAIMGSDKRKNVAFINNILLQLLVFYSYEDLKLVVFTNEENKENWEYVKYLNHNFDNERRFRFFASDIDSVKTVSEYLDNILNFRKNDKSGDPQKPHYLVIVDDYALVKRFDFLKNLTEADEEDNIGFSLILLEDKLNKLPSKCNNFISLSATSSILKNSYEKQEQIPFKDEVNYNIDMMNLARIMSNIPIEFESGVSHLPDSVTFLEMFQVGKVEQLNVLNHWNTSDPTMTLRAEVGLDNQGDVMYLDLHEKNHGPHGLIAGTTGSGKSEFIITYILSMCINYSPDDISFILIDYKGGGLALAFENRTAGIVLPHLAGTITNLDKAEMDRTLVSIESEAKRRQEIFNKTRDDLGESTMDIYKYQRLYKEGKVTEAISHLFIICDEFAELKAQQPDFMDNLISIARIGRSLGVHLILATQKPSGVVNDQIWSNSRFKVCLKVQDESDSKEMLKKPDAAYIKNPGRYYLLVGYDEYFADGQSGYTGAKYFPSDKIVKQVDKSINFINDFGQPVKSIQASSGPKQVAQGDQIKAVMDLIINLSKQTGKQARRLWLDNIPELIYETDIESKYNFKPVPYDVEAVIGEYDAPELQEQGIVTYNFLKDGNAIICGNDSVEREMLLESIIYSSMKNYTPDEINFYMMDLGSESLRAYEKSPFFGGYTTINEENRINNLFSIIDKEIARRKKLFIDYGGEYENYIKNSGKKIPLLAVIINNFDSVKDNFENLTFNILPSSTRDSFRYGVVYIITATGVNSVRSAIAQNFKHFFAFKLKEAYDYRFLFNKKKDITPRDITGRGILDNGDLHEFQVLTVSDADDKDKFVRDFVKETQEKYKMHKPYLLLPSMPEKVRMEYVLPYVSDLRNFPVGVSNEAIEIQYIDFVMKLGILVSALEFESTIPFTKSLVTLGKNINGINVIVLDPKGYLELDNSEFSNYYKDNFDLVLEKLKDYLDKLVSTESNKSGLFVVNGLDELLKKVSDQKLLEDIFGVLKTYEKFGVVVVEANNKIKNYLSQIWYKNVISSGNGIWIGEGANTQSSIACTVDRSMSKKLGKDEGYIINEGIPELSKLLDFFTEE